MTADEIGLVFSPEDSDLSLYSYRFDKDGYARRTVNRKPLRPITIYAHREVMLRKLGRQLCAGELIDHRNRNKLDCRRSNLRIGTKSLNSINRDAPATNTSGHKNICRRKRGRPFQWMFTVNGIAYQGTFHTLEEALTQLNRKKAEIGYGAEG